MLHPKHNRIDYGEQLIPPDGYELTRAIGTTYSLDLEAIMLLPVALFFAQHLDGNPDELRYDMLEAITRAADKITLYYQEGQLKVPRKYHPLIAYWEKGIIPVRMGHHAASFHPKVWVIRYDGKDRPPIYRLIVTSRNTTFDRSWDVACVTTGIVGEKLQLKAIPVLRFVEYLNSQRPIADAAFLHDLQYVSFEIPGSFEQFGFAPIGIPNGDGNKAPNPLQGKQWEELLIISPFLDNKTLSSLASSTVRRPNLLSSKDALDSINTTILQQFDAWQFSAAVESGELLEQQEDGSSMEPQPQHLHAKLFIGTLAGRVHWYLGSANCTDPAQDRNIEAMASLTAVKNAALNPRKILSTLTEQKGDGFPVFEPYRYEERNDTTVQECWDLELRRLKYALAGIPASGAIVQLSDGLVWELSISIDATGFHLPDGFTVHYKPLPEAERKPAKLKPDFVNETEEFGPYSEAMLSPFLEWSICKGPQCSGFLLPMEITLPDGRLNRIFSSIINSRDKFMKYLSFLLTEEDTGIIQPSGEGSTLAAKTWSGIVEDGTPVFEKLMIACSRSPEKLDAIDKLIERIKSEQKDDSEAIISEAFTALWAVFKEFKNAGK